MSAVEGSAVSAEDSKVLAAFSARDDLAAYGSNALLLFSLQLRHGIEDIEGVAATSLTDGSNDKKCDLVYVDRGAARVIVAQGYFSADTSKTEAPANKASDLNTAVSWLIAGDLAVVPDNLRSAAEEVRDALANDEVREFEIWYCHNLPESANVDRELTVAAKTADSMITRHFPDAQVNCSPLEIGRNHLEELYRRTEAPIAITDKFELQVDGGFEVASEQWRAFTTSVPATWLRDVWAAHGADLMSPNVRDYLGMTRSERNINNGIKTTASETPGQFWIYNNGLTILVHRYEVEQTNGGGKVQLTLSGLGIVNGAQTTGSIGTLSDAAATDLEAAEVLARFVMCEDPEVLGDIVKFNNTQNKVEAADFRSEDPVQERLRAEFEAIPDADYRGARRGGVKAVIERSRNLLADSAVAQSLAAFHLEPNLAYNETRRIWVDDGTYARFLLGQDDRPPHRPDVLPAPVDRGHQKAALGDSRGRKNRKPEAPDGVLSPPRLDLSSSRSNLGKHRDFPGEACARPLGAHVPGQLHARRGDRPLAAHRRIGPIVLAAALRGYRPRPQEPGDGAGCARRFSGIDRGDRRRQSRKVRRVRGSRQRVGRS